MNGAFVLCAGPTQDATAKPNAHIIAMQYVCKCVCVMVSFAFAFVVLCGLLLLLLHSNNNMAKNANVFGNALH